jgi:uncharacterized membrane protein YfcA
MIALFGLLIGAVVGMTGTGGPLAVPLLVLACGLPAGEAVGTSMLFMTIVKLLSAPVYVLRRQFSFATWLRMMAGGLPGVAAGAILLSKLGTQRLEHAVLATVGGTIAVLAIASFVRLWRTDPSAPRHDRSRWLPWVALPIGLEVGFSSAGAGALGGVALLSLTPLQTPVIIGTDLLFGLGLSAAGSSLHLALGKVNGQVAAQLLAGGAIGAPLGAWLGTRVPVRPLRAALSLVLSFSGAQLFWRGIAPILAQ